MDKKVLELVERAKAGDELTDEEKDVLRDFRDSQAADSTTAPNVADSMEQATGITGIDKPILQRIKADNCPAFRGSRVYISELMEFLETNPIQKYAENADDSGKAIIEIEIAKERRRKLQMENDERAGLLISREEINAEVFALGRQLQGVLRRVLENELPTKLAGRSVEEIRPVMREIVDDICKRFHSSSGQW